MNTAIVKVDFMFGNFHRPLSILFVWLALLLAPAAMVSAQIGATSPIVLEIKLFSAEGCPHCAKASYFLSELDRRRSDIVVSEYEITHSQDNLRVLIEVGHELNADVSGVPFIVVGSRHFSGFASAETTGREIEVAADAYLEEMKKTQAQIEPSPNLNQGTVESPPPPPAAPPPEDSANEPSSVDVSINEGDSPVVEPKDASESEKVSLPWFGEILVSEVSLPLLTAMIALLDGFNPCAMWTLLFLISLLLGLNDRKRMWLLGLTFIVTSAAVYFGFMAAWLNLFLFIGAVSWIRAVIGVVALAASVYYLRDYFRNRTGGCGVMGDEARQKFFVRARAAVGRKGIVAAMFGMAILAVAVNMIEALCSAGLPAIYTHVLSLSDLAKWQYYLYLLLYITIFMIDDLVVFAVAMVTLKAFGVESRYSRASRLIGGIVLLVIGLMLLLKPSLLMMG